MPSQACLNGWGAAGFIKKHTIMSNTHIPGLSFSLKRALGITRAKQQFAWQTGIPTTKTGIERKIGRALLKGLFGK